VWVKKCPLRFCGNFSKTLGNFWTKFYVLITRSYIRWTTNFYSIICNFDEVMPYKARQPTTQRAFQSTVDILSTLWWSRLIWHNFVRVAVNWIKSCIPAQIGTFNRCVKFELKIPNRLGKNVRKFQGGDFFLTHTVHRTNDAWPALASR